MPPQLHGLIKCLLCCRAYNLPAVRRRMSPRYSAVLNSSLYYQNTSLEKGRGNDASLTHCFNNSQSFSLNSHRWVTAPTPTEVVVPGTPADPHGISNCTTYLSGICQSLVSQQKPFQAVGQEIQIKFPGALPLCCQESMSMARCHFGYHTLALLEIF